MTTEEALFDYFECGQVVIYTPEYLDKDCDDYEYVQDLYEFSGY